MYSDKICSNRAKVVVFGQRSCIREKVVIGQKLLYSCKVVVFGEKWLYSKKSSCIRAKVVVFGQNGFIRINWYYSGKIVVHGQGGCN